MHSGGLAPAGAGFPAAQSLRTANDGERTQVRGSVCWEPCVCTSQQKVESPRPRLGDSFRRFLVGEKTTYASPLERRNVFFSFRKEKNEKKPRTYRSIVCAADSGSVVAMKDGIHAREARVIRGLPSSSYFPHGVFRRGLRTLCGTQTRVGSRVYMLPSRRMGV